MSSTDHTTPDHLTGLAQRAQDAQDAIGWANYDNPAEMSTAVMKIAREVTLLARAVDWQQTVIDAQQQVITELKRQQ